MPSSCRKPASHTAAMTERDDLDYRLRLGAAARKRAEEAFAYDVLAARLDGVLRALG